MNENTYTRSVDSETHCPSFLISVRPNQNCFLCRLNPLRLISSEISLFSLLDSISTSLAFWLLQNLFASYQFIGLSLNLCSSISLGLLANVSIHNLHVAACRKSHPWEVTCTSLQQLVTQLDDPCYSYFDFCMDHHISPSKQQRNIVQLCTTPTMNNLLIA